jgi:hypothetical protein
VRIDRGGQGVAFGERISHRDVNSSGPRTQWFEAGPHDRREPIIPVYRPDDRRDLVDEQSELLRPERLVRSHGG